MANTPDRVWVIQTRHGNDHIHYSVAVGAEADAVALIIKERAGEEITGSKQTRNFDGIEQGKFKQIYEGPYNPDKLLS